LKVHACCVRAHIDKKSREQFEIRTLKRLIEIFDTNQQTMDAMNKVELSPVWMSISS
jgi:small subunit ribosomal protein S10